MRTFTRNIAIFILIFSGVIKTNIQAQGLETTWAYHDDADGIDDRASESIPGESLNFIGNGATSISTSNNITLYVMTDKNFAGDKEEQVLLRWWNGESEEWIFGGWEKNIKLGGINSSFHGYPSDGEQDVDLWKIEIPAEKTKPGDNYYAIQLKGWTEAESTEHFLLRVTGETGKKNQLDQAWIETGDYFNKDWIVKITE